MRPASNSAERSQPDAGTSRGPRARRCQARPRRRRRGSGSAQPVVPVARRLGGADQHRRGAGSRPRRTKAREPPTATTPVSGRRSRAGTQSEQAGCWPAPRVARIEAGVLGLRCRDCRRPPGSADHRVVDRDAELRASSGAIDGRFVGNDDQMPAGVAGAATASSARRAARARRQVWQHRDRRSLRHAVTVEDQQGHGG